MTDLLITSVETDTPQVNVTASSGNSENGTVSGGGVFDINSNITLSATAHSGYAFAGWYNGSKLYSNENPLTLEKVRNDISLTARFAIQKGKEETASFDIAPDKPFVKNTSRIQLAVTNAKDKDGYTVGNLTASDIDWSCNEAGVNISESGIVTFDAEFVIDKNSKKAVNITGKINNAVQTIAITVYSYEYYEEFSSAATNYDGDFKNIAEKDCIIFPAASKTTTYTLTDTIQLDNIKTITLNHAWSGSNTCGQFRTLNFKDGSDNIIFSMYYEWTSLVFNGTKLSGVIKKNEFSPLVIEINPKTDTVTVTAGGQSASAPLNGNELSKIEFVSARSVPSGRDIGLSDIIIK